MNCWHSARVSGRAQSESCVDCVSTDDDFEQLAVTLAPYELPKSEWDADKRRCWCSDLSSIEACGTDTVSDGPIAASPTSTPCLSTVSDVLIYFSITVSTKETWARREKLTAGVRFLDRGSRPNRGSEPNRGSGQISGLYASLAVSGAKPQCRALAV